MIFLDDVLSQASINRDINAIAKGEDIVLVVPTRFFTSECKPGSFVLVGMRLANSWYKGVCDWDVKCVVKAICLLDIKLAEKKRIQQNYVVIVILPPVKSWSSRQDIGFRILFPGDMMERKVIVLELSKPSCLSSIEFLRLFEVLEIGVIRPDLKFVFRIDKIATKFFKSQHDGEELAVVNFIISLCSVQCFGHISDWPPFIILFL